MNDSTISTKQITKFGFYGLLKNLKFFEPYLLLYLIFADISFTEIGILYAIREAIIYIFEIPSGVFADRYGKKNELVLSFIFYIVSFIMFYFANSFILFIIPMVLFGFGEAFRSGTHKAMIMEYLDHNHLETSKRKMYGLTRSYSNIGSAISSLFGIVLILYLPNLSLLFLIAIIPYVLDLLLILTYPNYLNQKVDTTFTWRGFLKENVNSVRYAFQTKKLTGYLLDSASFGAVFKTLKDYIQPLIYGAGIVYLLLENQTLDVNVKVYIGLTYAIAQIISVFVTKYAYLIRSVLPTNVILQLAWLLTAVMSIVVGIYYQQIVVIVIAFIMFYISLNIRKPYMVQKIGDNTENQKRASVLSIESQLTSIMIIVFAPIVGFLSDNFGIGTMFVVVGCLMTAISVVRLIKKGA